MTMIAWKRNALLIAAGLALALGLCEGGLRLAQISYPYFHAPDPYRGYALSPGVEGWYTNENRAYIRVNSLGMRDREHSVQKPTENFRVAVLGDSFTEAFQVDREKTFWSVLESELADCPTLSNKTPEVLNFGVGGYGTAQELLTLRHQVWQFDPDLILLAFFSGNDVRNNSKKLQGDNRIPYFIFEGGRLTLDAGFRDTAWYRSRTSWKGRTGFWILNYFRTAQVLKRAWNLAWSDATAQGAVPDNVNTIEAGLDDTTFRESVNPDWKMAWHITGALISQMNREVKEKSKRFFVSTITSGIQVHPDKKIRKEFKKKMQVKNLFYPGERLEALGMKQGFPMLSLAPPFQAYADQKRVFLHGFGDNLGIGHWNERGHGLGGRLMANFICEKL